MANFTKQQNLIFFQSSQIRVYGFGVLKQILRLLFQICLQLFCSTTSFRDTCTDIAYRSALHVMRISSLNLANFECYKITKEIAYKQTTNFFYLCINVSKWII